MDPRTRNLFFGAILGIVVLVGGAAYVFSGTVNDDGGTIGPDPVTGVIVAVDAAGLSDVRGFTLRTQDGTLMEFRLERLENATAFPPGHFAEHQATAEPVVVRYQGEGDALFAIQVEDAPASGVPGY